MYQPEKSKRNHQTLIKSILFIYTSLIKLQACFVTCDAFPEIYNENDFLSGSLWVLVLVLFLFFKQMCLASVFTGLVNLCAGIFGRSQVYFLYIYIHASVFKWKHLSFQCQ